MKGKQLVLVLLLTSLCILNACADKEGEFQSIVYENTNHHFTLEIPRKWKDKYAVVEANNRITFSDKINGPAGQLFTVEIWPKAKWDREGTELVKIIHIAKIGEIGDAIFTFHTPSDVQYAPDDEMKKQQYLSMFHDVESIRNSFKLKQ
ncbi:methyltransferase [Paenibacillus sp. RC67]|uniref:methyltransferase n=1 Tax=Paenibacillus sp. RC67 TaxID=3039392 RepID=UPI0024AE7F93|nr:methyltransferase [Paenibacillus sp. RC67]